MQTRRRLCFACIGLLVAKVEVQAYSSCQSDLIICDRLNEGACHVDIRPVRKKKI